VSATGRRRTFPIIISVVVVAVAVVAGLLVSRNTQPRGAIAAPKPGLSASRSSPTPTAPFTAPAATVRTVVVTPPPAGKVKAAANTAASYVRYTVKLGDNLWEIADWFHQQGYTPIYQWNKTTIGRDPSLIRPGQVLIVAVKA
jgi:nucleoid-associated protein YgaU